MNGKTIQFVTVFILAFLLGAVVIQVKQETVASAQDGTAVSGAVSPLLHYQGRLTDPGSGQPVADGSYTMTIRLYTAPSGGTTLWAETKDVPVKGGLFSTLLGDVTPLAQNIFTGQALWLGIKVGADEEAKPRQQMVPVAYALSLVPGASIQANSSTAALNLSNGGSGNALTTWGPVVVQGDLTVDGAINNPEIVTQYEFLSHIYGGNHHERYTDEEAINAVGAKLPVAYGHINSDCTLLGVSINVSCSITSTGCYLIPISGHYYDWNYVTVVTPQGLEAARIYPDDGKLRICLLNIENEVASSSFHFVTFKP